MISEDRPYCVVIPIDFDNWKQRELRRQLAETIHFDGDMEDESHVPGRIVEACQAEWCKYELDADGKRLQHTCQITQITTDVYHYVKCMEPAVWWLHVPGRAIVKHSSFCEFHKPKVRPI